MVLTWEITALLLFELSPAHSVYAMPSYIPSIKWECCYPTIRCAGEKFRCSLLQEHLKKDVAFREDITGFYIIGEQNSESIQAWNRMQIKEEKEEPSGKMNLTYQ